MPPPIRRHAFPAAHRLSGARAFAAVYDARARKHAGPLTVLTRPNGLPHHRLGLSVGRRVGHAPRRSLAKRQIREAFRLQHRGWLDADPIGHDLVVVVKPHAPAPTTEYLAWLDQAFRAARAVHHTRAT